MDFDFIFWAAIAAIYLFQFILGKKKNAAHTGTPVPELESNSSEGDPSFQEALSEISRMLAGDIERPPEPAPKRVPAPKPVPALIKSTSVVRTQKHGLPPIVPSHGSSFYDEEFEKKDYVDFHRPEITHENTRAPVAKKTRETLLSAAKRDIHDVAKAQEALVLAEVIGPPISKRRGRRRV